jgi:predicted ribosomally synthesized six-cysteine peptide SCIFF
MSQLSNQITQITNKNNGMNHVKTLNKNNMTAFLLGKTKSIGCGECQASCQSACKTSCTVANQKCENN